jgi:hypothetical protein
LATAGFANRLCSGLPTPKGQPAADIAADDSGRAIIALLQKASETTKQDCARAMDVAHRLSFHVHAAEERVREDEAEVAHFRERATRAEAWLLRIHNETKQAFFQKASGSSSRLPCERNINAPKPRR